MVRSLSTAIVTGAASGIGLETAVALARKGWQLVLLDRDGAGLAAAVQRLCVASGQVHQAIVLDLCDRAQIAALGQKIDGDIKALVNNAGLSDSSGTPVAERDFASLQQVIALNLTAPQLLIEALAPHFAPRPRILNISSGAGLRAIPWRGAYSASKAGLIAFGQAWMGQHPEHEVITLCPGFFRTALVDSLIAQGRLSPAQSVAKIPLGRMGEPHEIADFIAFLLTPDATGLIGQTISLDGGSSVFGGSKAYEPTPHAPVAAQDYHSLVVEAYEQPLAGVQQAAVDLLAQAQGPASLTVLLSSVPSDPAAAAEHGAAVMLIKTLACELGPQGLRVNGVIAPHGLPPKALAMIAGAECQYLTGQILTFAQGTRDE